MVVQSSYGDCVKGWQQLTRHVKPTGFTGHLPTTVGTKPGVQSGLLSLSLSARGVGGVGRCLQSCIHCTSCVFSRWWVQTAGAPQTSEIHGVFSFCWKFGPFVRTTLCRFLFEIVANQKFAGTPPTFHQKTKKPLNDLEHNQLIENCIMSIILLYSFKQSLPSTSWPEMKIMFSLCNGWDCLPIDKFLNSWFENI